MTQNQHCQHFASSLVQGRVIILPTPQPHALLTPTLHRAGGCPRHTLGPCLPDPCWDRGKLDP